MPVPIVGEDLLLCSNPVAQGRRVMDLLAEEAGRFGPKDVAIGVADRQVIPYLSAELNQHGLRAYDPAGHALSDHPVFHLLDAVRRLLVEGSYAAFAALLRHPDFLAFLQQDHAVDPSDLLRELDGFQNEALPQSWEEIASSPMLSSFACLRRAVDLVDAMLSSFGRAGLVEAVQELLTRVYGARELRPGSETDDAFRSAARLIRETLAEMGQVSASGTGAADAFEILIRCLSMQVYYPDHAGARVDLEGWLELPWNDAPFLVVTGMNEGYVTDGQVRDVFLPDRLRRTLKLRHDEDRFARDVFLLTSLLRSREAGGRVVFTLGKKSMNGDVLKPSRLLFLCDDAELPERARLLFGAPEDPPARAAAELSFVLDPSRCAQKKPEIGKLSVTAFRAYLGCPFRFYLSRVLGMEKADDDKPELDAMDFGNLVHHALEQLARDKAARKMSDVDELAGLLSASAFGWVRDRFGGSPPFQVLLQLESAKQRLGYAAEVQMKQWAAGWEIVASEFKAEAEIGGIRVTGKIDRIERHRESGAIRVLDYKTSDKAHPPAGTHFGPAREGVREYARLAVGGREKAWADLQLPLYAMLLEGTEYDAPGSLGYFNLPKAVRETNIYAWDDFDDDLRASAKACVEGVIADITNARFWPPAEKIPYDDFEILFPQKSPENVTALSFL